MEIYTEVFRDKQLYCFQFPNGSEKRIYERERTNDKANRSKWAKIWVKGVVQFFVLFLYLLKFEIIFKLKKKL